MGEDSDSDGKIEANVKIWAKSVWQSKLLV